MSDTLLQIIQDGPSGDDVRVRLIGDATIYTANELKDRLLFHLCSARRLELDLSGLGEIDSTAVQILALCQREAEQAKKDLRLRQPPPRLVAVLSLYGLGDLLKAAAIPTF